ncbi:retrovirus-related pol polyprotein from transposon TNT 1-94 [Tanacetum coccineum]
MASYERITKKLSWTWFNQSLSTPRREVLLKLDWAINQNPKALVRKTVAFTNEGSNNFDTDKIMATMNVMTMKMDAQYKEMKSHTEYIHCGGNHSTADCNDDDIPIDDEDEEPTPEPQTPKPNRKLPTPKPYKPIILYPQCLQKEKIEAQYRKFLDMICVIRINVSLFDVLAGMPNYGKFLKELYVCPAVGSTYAYIMADLNIPANDAPVEQAPVVAPSTRTDDQILSLSKWVPIGKFNCVLDVHKPQRNPIFPIAVNLLKNTNFFRAFTTSSTIPAIYIQQFWDTMCFNTSTGLYSCQLDEQWFNLHKDLLKDALDITPTNDNNPFVASPFSDTVIEYVNTLGYPSTLRNVSAMYVNALYQPWRAVLSMINMCLTGKTARYVRPRHPVLQILWGIIHRSNIDYAKRIWEEFVQSIQTFLTDRKNLTTASRRKKEIHQTNHPSPKNQAQHSPKDWFASSLLTRRKHYEHSQHVAKYQQFLDAERGKAKEGGATESFDATKVTKPKAAKVSEKKQKLVKETPDEPSPAKRSKGGLVGKRRKLKSPLKLVDVPSDEGVPVEDPAHTDEEADLQRALELCLKEQAERTQGPARLVVLREPDSGKYQPLPETLTKKSLVDQFIFQRRPPMPTEPTGHADSPSLDTELALTDSEMESDKEVPVINIGDQDEGQAGPNPCEQDKGQVGPNPGIQDKGHVGSNPGDVAESQPQPSHGVHAGPNREHMDLEATDASSQQKPEKMDEEFTTTAYPNIQENLKLPTEDQVILKEPASSTGTLSSLQNLEKDLSFTDQFFVEKPHEEESGKTNAETEV